MNATAIVKQPAARPTVARNALALLALSLSFCLHADVVFTVDTPADQVDTDTSDGLCRTSTNQCSLRAAIMQANRITGAGATIVLSAGVYTLARPASSNDADDTGDLNLAGPASGGPAIAIIGAGAATTLIDGNKIDRVLS